ncbi:MAG TPA: pilus assembly protein PilM [Solirubrobacteraceae bacterium]|nr:pilus assembly protein PilM [Solirubrobacteraceae bacterium]
MEGRPSVQPAQGVLVATGGCVEEETVRISSLLPDGPIRLGTRRSSATVALDIGPDAIVVLQSSGTERARVRRAIVHPLPVGLVVDGEVVNAEALAVELRQLFAEHKLPHDVRVGLAHPRLMVRMVELPGSLSGRELDGAVRHLAGDLLPVGLDQLVVDFRRVGKAPAGSGPPQQRVLMAAARVDGIDRFVQALSSAHLKAERIQLSGLAMLAALQHPPLAGQAILYVQTGALTNVVIAEDGEPLLVRAASAGSESIAAGLAERTQITHEEARAHIAALGVRPAPRHGPPAAISDELEAAVSLQVREGLRRVIAEIQSSRGFYSARPDARTIGGVVLTGAMTTWPGVAELLREELNLPVLPAGRDAWPDLGTVSVAPERLDVAVGLALAADDERPDLRPIRFRTEQREVAPDARVAQVLCGVVTLLAALVVYLVILSNQVSSGQERIAQISGEVTASERQAADLKPYADFAKATTDRRETVKKVAAGRFAWDRAMRELSQVAPGDVWLTSVKGTLSATSSVEGGAGGGGGLRGALAGPALELEGCGKREGDVPKYMDRLHSMSGVEDVGFTKSERVTKPTTSGAAGAIGGQGAAGASTGGGCSGSDSASTFSLVTYFQQSAAGAAADAQAAAPAVGAAAAAVTPAAATPAPATPAATGAPK